MGMDQGSRGYRCGVELRHSAVAGTEAWDYCVELPVEQDERPTTLGGRTSVLLQLC